MLENQLNALHTSDDSMRDTIIELINQTYGVALTSKVNVKDIFEFELNSDEFTSGIVIRLDKDGATFNINVYLIATAIYKYPEVLESLSKRIIDRLQVKYATKVSKVNFYLNNINFKGNENE